MGFTMAAKIRGSKASYCMNFNDESNCLSSASCAWCKFTYDIYPPFCLPPSLISSLPSMFTTCYKQSNDDPNESVIVTTATEFEPATPSPTMAVSNAPSFSPKPTHNNDYHSQTDIKRVSLSSSGNVLGVADGKGVSISSDGTTFAIGGETIQITKFQANHQLSEDSQIPDYLMFAPEKSIYEVSLSSNGQTLIIGNYESGVIVVSKVDGTYWYQIGSMLTGDTKVDQFGSSVDISNDGRRIIVGTKASNYVNIYDFMNEKGWMLIQRLSVGLNNFGAALSLSGDGHTIAISDPIANNTNGIVYLYDGNTFDILQTIYGGNEEDEAGTYFGYSISLSDDGKRLAIGSSGGSYIKVYERTINETYKLIGETIIGISDDKFGSSVSISGDGNNVATGASGSFFSYTFSNSTNTSTWILTDAKIFDDTDDSLQDLPQRINGIHHNDTPTSNTDQGLIVHEF